MKRIYFIFIGFLIVLTACEENLNLAPISEPSASNFYKDTEDFEIAVNGIYHALGSYSTNQLYLSEVRSDNVYSVGTGVREWNAINNFERTLPSNSLISDTWNSLYRGIYLANMVLDNIDEEKVPDSSTRARMIGEAKFLRSLLYLDLVRFFGRVPIYDRAYTPTEALEIGRSPVEDVYVLIEEDLSDAINNLPESYPSNQTGKATSNAAKALLAKVYLTMSGPDYGINGPGMGVNKYNDALSLFNQVISSNQYSWVNDYASIFDYDNENNPDIVFDIQSINDGATGDRGIGTVLPSLLHLESYGRMYLLLAGGVPNDGNGGINPSEDLLDSFESQDVRDDFSVLMSYIDPNGNPVNFPQFIKFLSLDHIPADIYNWGINFPIIRYTDVLMMKAEALLKTGGDQAEVDQIVNQVRTRAGLTDISDVTIDTLLEERRREFMAEGLRWHDLVRSGKVIEIMNEWVEKEDLTGLMNTMVANDIIYPIHQDQLEVKKGLYDQNPGY